MSKPILTNALVKGWIVYPYKYGLLDSSGKALPLPAHYAEVVQCGKVACGDSAAKYR